MRRRIKVAILLSADRIYTRDILKGILKYCKTKGTFTLLFPPPPWGKSSALNTDDFIEDARPDVIVSDDELNLKYREKCALFALANSYKKGSSGILNIKTDHVAVGRMGAEYMLQTGAMNFAFSGYSGFYWSKIRENVYRKHIERKGYKVYLNESSVEKSDRENLSELERWIKCLPKPAAIMAASDDKAFQISEISGKLGLRVGKDVLILGCNDDDFLCNFGFSPISSIHLDTEKKSFQMCGMIEEAIARKRPSSDFEILISPVFVEQRASTAFNADKKSLVARAVTVIKNRKSENLCVSNLAAEIGVSKRTLERAFKEELGNSVKATITQTKIEEIKKYIADTDLRIKEIGGIVGFGDPNQISRFFKKHAEQTPSEYRKTLFRARST